MRNKEREQGGRTQGRRGRATARTRTPRALIAGRAAAGVVSFAVLATSGAAWATYHWINGGLNTSDALDAVRKRAPKHLDDSVNLLLIGLDSRKDMNGNDLPDEFIKDELHAGSSSNGFYNTNTLILLHIPADGGKVQAFSIPRDDYVQTYNGDGSPQAHPYKIKEAYGNAYEGRRERLSAKGEKGAELEADSREAGREATLATVQNFLDVPIDHFAEVNLKGFYDIAQALGGIDVCLKHAVKEKNSGADFHAGRQTLNARQALAFVRQRHGLPQEDLSRTHRQQAFISSVTHKLKTEGVFDSLDKLQKLFGVVKKDLVIDSSLNVIDFSQQATNLTGGKVEFRTLPTEGSATRNNEDVQLVNVEKVRGLVKQVFYGGAAPSASASDGKSGGKSKAPQKAAPGTVDVRNGTGRTEPVASEELKALTALGYSAGSTANAEPQSQTTVVYGKGAQEAAKQIAARLGATVAPAPNADIPAGHVQVTLGANYAGPKAPSGGPSPSNSPSSSPSEKVDDSQFAGDTVKEGGIPCVD
ncbi:LCP family protein [Streptomyces orinoci]|uniref:LCP family protein n=1 Tax=Streptomyces orinoci TaxID=67339 RepID=A0ABV3JXY4_STRON|nr:LCP family protein [Streptomyces orinoci]